MALKTYYPYNQQMALKRQIIARGTYLIDHGCVCGEAIHNPAGGGGVEEPNGTSNQVLQHILVETSPPTAGGELTQEIGGERQQDGDHRKESVDAVVIVHLWMERDVRLMIIKR